MPRLYREAPLLSIWEGSGNVAALDALRAMTRQPHTLEVLVAELELALGADRRFDSALVELKDVLADTAGLEHRARRVAERVALVLQGSLLVRGGHPPPPTRFASADSAVTGVRRSARCPSAWTPPRSSLGPPPRSADTHPVWS